MSLKIPGFKDLVVSTARETCVRGFKNVKDEVEIDSKYHVLKGVSYKQGEVVTMIISKEKSKEEWEEKKEQPKMEDKVKTAGPKEPALKKGFMTAKKTTLKGNTSRPTKTGGGGRRGGGEAPDGRTIPFYTVAESGTFDLGDHTVAGAEEPRLTNRPRDLVYRIELPLEKSAGGIELDVSSRKLVLTSDNYSLNAELTYTCEGDKGKAKWDKKKKVLTVTVPVKKPTEEELEDIKAKHKVVEVVGTTEVDDLTSKLNKVASEVSKEDEVGGTKKPPPRKQTTKCKREAFAVDEPIPTDNSAAEMYKNVKKGGSSIPPASSPEKPKEEKLRKEKEQLVKVEGGFTKTDKFDGPRVGYVFKKGNQGVGYYKDGGVSTSSPKKPGKVEEKEGENDKFEYRQSSDTVTILIQVSGIDQDSVEADFEPYKVRLTFKKEGEGRIHAFQLDNLFAEIDTEESR